MITIIIPTFNRAAFLARSLKYYLLAKCSHHIVIADSSDDKNFHETNRLVLESSERLSVEHRRFPNDFSNYQCIDNVLDSVGTPFVAVIGDDDMLVPDTLTAAATFLTENSGFSGVVGDAITVRTQNNSVWGPLIETGRYDTGARIEDSPVSRVLKCIDESNSFDYALMRRETRVASVKAAVHGHLYRKFGFFGELANVMILAAAGKIHKLSKLMLVRQIHTTNSTFETSQDIFDKICDAHWPAAVANLRSSIETALTADGSVGSSLASRVAKKVVWTYVNRNFGKALDKFSLHPSATNSTLGEPNNFKNYVRNSAFGQLLRSKLRPWSLSALSAENHRLHSDFSIVRASFDESVRG